MSTSSQPPPPSDPGDPTPSPATTATRHRTRRARVVQSTRRLLRWAAFAALSVTASWLVIAIHPQPMFAHSVQRANVVLHAQAPLPAQAGPMLDEVVRRLSRSPLYRPERKHHVFLCETARMFALFALWDHRVGGIAQVYLTGNVFIRPADVATNQVIGPSGQPKGGERTLTYFLAHEVAHAMTADRTGRLGYHKLTALQQEGYADLVAFDDRPIDLRAGREAIHRDAPEMSPSRSGLYRRYEVLVAFLLRRRGLSVDDLIARPLSRSEVERQLDQATDL